jgi:hypothetical protein
MLFENVDCTLHVLTLALMERCSPEDMTSMCDGKSGGWYGEGRRKSNTRQDEKKFTR